MGRKKPITINETLDRVILDSSERVFYFAKKRLRHRWYVAWLVIVAASAGFALYSFFVRANAFNFYPSSCLGTWDNPQNAQGEPSLEPGAAPEEFNKDNSAFYDGSGAKQVFCGGFQSNGDETEKIFKKAILKFTWAIAVPASSSSGVTDNAPAQVLQQSEFESQALDLTASASVIVIPDGPASVSVPFESESQTPEPDLVPSMDSGQANSPQATPEPVPEPTPAPEPLPPASEPAPEPPVSLLERFTLASIFSDVASESISSPIASPTPASISQPSVKVKPSFSPEIPASLSPSFIPAPTSSPSFYYGSPTSIVTPSFSPLSTASASSSPSPELASASYSLDDFLEVFYTTDGQNWQPLGRVNKDNFENLELKIPIASWEELGKLQIGIAGIFVTDAPQNVYLDGMRIETEFEKMAEKKKKDVNSDELIFELEKNLTKWNISESASNSAQVLGFMGRIIENDDRFYKISDIDGDLVPDFAINVKNVHDGEAKYDFKKFEIYSGKDGNLIGQFEETESEGRYYLIFAGLPDINSDGVSDYAILDPGFSTGEGGAIANERGKITARSGKDNSTLWVYTGTTDYQFYGDNSVMKLGADYDGDGLGDLLVSVPLYEKESKRGAVLIVSSSKGELINLYQGKRATGDDLSVIYRFDIGPDLNSDGWPEIVLGEIHNRSNGQDSKASLLSGKNLSVIGDIANPDSDEFSYFGVDVAFIGDENGDGIDDILVKAISKRPSPNNSSEKFLVFSSVDRSFITYYEE